MVQQPPVRSHRTVSNVAAILSFRSPRSYHEKGMSTEPRNLHASFTFASASITPVSSKVSLEILNMSTTINKHSLSKYIRGVILRWRMALKSYCMRATFSELNAHTSWSLFAFQSVLVSFSSRLPGRKRFH